MSHFVVMVVTKTQDEKELKNALQPFHEYECTGTMDQYVVFDDCHDEVVKDWKEETQTAYRSPAGKIYDGYEDIFYREPTKDEEETVGMGSGFGNGISWTSKDWGDGKGYRAKVHFVPEGFEEFKRPISECYQTMEEYAKQYYGCNIIKNGRIGRYTNPNKKWDWWVVGGRYSDWLMLKNGIKADSAVKSDIDYARMIEEARDAAAKKYDDTHKIIKGRTWITWEQAKADNPKDINKAREIYNGQQVIKDLKDLSFWEDKDEFLTPREQYIDQKGKGAIVPFAILAEGKWMQRGEMGWWACVSDEKEDWDTEFHEIFKDIPEGLFITIVDCHI